MTTYTRTQLITRAMRELRIIADDEDPSAEQHAFCLGAYDAKIEEWTDSRLIWWTSADAIPGIAFPVMSKLLATEIAPRYGKSTMADREAAERVFLKTLRALTERGDTGLPVESPYF